MTAKQDHSALREQAVALRIAGKSLREIRETLGPVGKTTLNEMLRGTPPAEWTLRPNAKDELRAKARELRAQGLAYAQIATQLGVSKSSVSLWIRDMPVPARLSPEERRKRSADGLRRFWEREHANRDEFRTAVTRGIGALSDREVIIAGAIAYWCEGSKSKPHRRVERVIFINSDPGLITFFMRFLGVAGVRREDLILRVYIHENADIAAAEAFWRAVTDLPASQFRSPTLKRHNPKTVRMNTGEDYHGCLRIDVRRSGELYRRIEGWVAAATTGQALSAAYGRPVS
jgi:transcriptional regulator with XRE-family HTH domain